MKSDIEIKEDKEKFFKNYAKKNSSKFKKFLTMLVSFIDKKDIILEKKDVKEVDDKTEYLLDMQEKLVSLVDKIISLKKEDQLLIILKKGYQLNEDQCLKVIESKIQSTQIKEAITIFFENTIKVKLSNELKEFNNYENEIYRLHLIEEFDYYSESDHFDIVSEKIYNFSYKAITFWKYLNFDPTEGDDEFVLSFLENCNSFKLTLNSLPKKDSICAQIEKKIDEYILKIEVEKKNEIEKQFINNLDKFNVVFNDFEKIKKNLTNHIVINLKNFNESDLPNPSREMIKEIKAILSEIDLDELSTDQKIKIDNFYEKRLPQVLEEYITISPRYREKLLHHNENPDSLLLESLTEIKKGISNVFESLQEEKVKNMKISNRYLKSKNNL